MKKEEYPIIKKAWKIKVDDLDEPWHFEDIIEYGETAGIAKGNFVKFGRHHDMLIIESHVWLDYKKSRRDVEYKDIEARRCKARDIVLYNGNEIRREDIEKVKWVEERDKHAYSVVADAPDAICVVYAGCYNSYWGTNHCGYTSSIENAGKYSAEEARKIVIGSDYSRQETVQVIDVEEYNKNINEKISELESKILKLRACKL